MRPKILVIGSRDHNRADCVDWLQPFPNIEEYDSIIINLQSLTQDVYDKIQMKIRGMRESITTVFTTDREIFCLMNKLIYPSPPRSRVGKGIVADYISPTSYDWLPVKIEVNYRKKGTSIILHDHRFDRYFEYVDRWSFEISISIGTTQQDRLAYMFHGIVPIATNKSKKTIAGSLKYGWLGLPDQIRKKGAIHLLPPLTKFGTHQAIEIILDLICGEEEKIVPSWRKDIEVPKIKELEQKIGNKIEGIKRIQQEISQLRIQIQQWDSYRDLLIATGDDLENIVQRALADVGIKTKKTERAFPADLISNEVAVEITGIKGCVGVSSEKVIQTARFKESYEEEKVILIANTYMELPPEDRKGKIDFSPEVEKYFESSSVCCLTTETLFQLWKDVITKKKDPKDVTRKILTKNGELVLSEFVL